MAGTTASTATDTPATALGPTALVLGAFSAVGTWAFLIPWTVIAGALAMTFGAMGIHYARKGTSRLWTAATGTALGTAGFIGTITLLRAMY
ncbi:hypothetical protein GCM10010313_36320 [Streptomyces violarus]|uniref:Mg2+ and Co2+ transporter CorA n=1 Tax=Streptomyces violarus TaxID=67380 RepID=A0A7W4ZPP7_9ACTN|nr:MULTISPECIES: hypothetical protein [Streptomyces]MBB3076345.1 Mg2+ and Co2+ transporter CorA [Streptomyces violarus]WRT99152.1 hypothetical protein VJ737_16285 [Streptomyces sp. CGMCC 4.1772]GHD12277.1 hypothetical protein GCM10010313_36320 [Streptomyces violarus]